MKKKLATIKRVSLMTAATGMLVGTIAGCGTADSPKASPGSSTAPSATATAKKQVTVSIMVPQFTTEPIKPDSAAVKKIEEYTGVKLEMNWVVGAAYQEKLNATIASGTMPKVLTVTNNKEANIVNGARSGMFWEIGGYLKDYPNLSKLNTQIVNNISIDGKLYGLPRTRPISRQGIIFRKDWLDNLGLQPPKTTDDLYNILQAFTNKDPDKNGKNDTFGLSDQGIAFNDLAIYFGAPNKWGVQAGKLIPDFTTPEYLEAMQFTKRLYSEKLMNQDFLIVKDGYVANINQGKAGVVVTSAVDGVTTALYADLKKLNPNAVLDITTGLRGPKGEYSLGGAAFAGTLMFPKSSVKTEQDLKDMLQFFDKMTDQAMIDLTLYGVEGHTYTLENGVPKINSDLYNNEINPLNQIMVKLGMFGPKKGDSPMETKWKQILVENEKKAVFDPTVPFISQTFVEKGAQLDKQIQDARNKFIIGELDEAGWKSAIDTWRKNGGDKIAEEYSVDYAKARK